MGYLELLELVLMISSKGIYYFFEPFAISIIIKINKIKKL